MALSNEVSSNVRILKIGSRFLNPMCWLNVRRIIKEIKPNCVFGWSTYSNFIACLVSIGNDTHRTIIGEINYPPLEYRQSGIIRCCILRLLTFLLYRKADIITANSNEALNILRQWIGKKSKVFSGLFNPLNFGEIAKLADEKLDEEDLFEHELIVLAVGRLDNSHKGFDVLASRYSKAKKNSGRFQMRNCGEGAR